MTTRDLPFPICTRELVACQDFGAEALDHVRLEFAARADIAAGRITEHQYTALLGVTTDYRKGNETKPRCSVATRHWVQQVRTILQKAEGASA